MNKNTVYLHIGIPKTATTTIQKSLFENKKALLSSGYLYPDTGITDFGHHNLARELSHFQGQQSKFIPGKGTLDELVDEIDSSKVQNIIISSEVFAPLNEGGINILKNKLSNYNVRIIIYLRRQDHFLFSHWAQGVKYMTIVAPFNEWVKGRLSENKAMPVANYKHLLKKWSSAFGKQNIILRIFEKEELQGHIFHDFLSACNVIEPAKYPFSNDLNISPSIKTLEIIRTLNKHAGFYRDSKYREFAHIIGNLILIYYANLPSESAIKHPVDNQIASEILDFYHDANEFVAERYLGRKHLFKPYESQKFIAFDISRVTGMEVLKLFGFVIPRLFDILLMNGKEMKQVPSPAGVRSGALIKVQNWLFSLVLKKTKI